MNWSPQDTEQFTQWFLTLPEPRQLEIDAKAVSLFCNLWMLRLIDPNAPKTAPQMTGDWLAKFRNLALMTEAAYVQPWRDSGKLAASATVRLAVRAAREIRDHRALPSEYENLLKAVEAAYQLD